jgi:hypothetical protein
MTREHRVQHRVEAALIPRRLASICLSACIALAGHARAQSIPNSVPDTPTRQPQDRSFYLGTPVTHPEALSGIWEAPDGHGGAVGIHLVLDTTVPVDATTLVGVRQAWLGLQAGLYRRTGGELQPGEENFFSDSVRGGSVRFEQGRLTLHAPGYDLDLHRAAGDTWSGRFHREDFDAFVTLVRPALQAATKEHRSAEPRSLGTPFIGTWKSSSGPSTTCLHIAQLQSGAFVAWADTLLAWGSAAAPSPAVKPPYSWEHYGDLVKVEPAGNGSLSIELGAYSGICCPHRFHASSSDHGKEMKADWPSGPNQVAHKSKWIKMDGDSCVAPASQ